MMGISKRFIFIICIVVQQVLCCLSFDVCIDAIYGIDHTECALPRTKASNSSSKCCQTLSYAFITSNNTDLIIALNGGDVEPIVYMINASISVDRNLTLTRSDTSQFSPVVKFDSQQRTNFIFTVQASVTSTMVGIRGIHFVDTNIIQCQETSCHLNISDCKAVCEKEGCSKTTFVYFKNNPSVSSLVVRNSYFKSDRYLLSSVNSKHLNIDMRHVRMVNNGIYVTNKDLSNRATIKFQNITASGIFPLYVLKLYGYFGSVDIEQLYIRDSTMKVEGAQLKFLRNIERLVPLFVSNIVIDSTTNFGENLFDIERALVEVKDIVITGSTLTSAFQFYQCKGNISHIDARSSWFRHVLVLQYVGMYIKDVIVSRCEFEKVRDYRDYRFGRWAPRARKSLIFLEYSAVVLTHLVVHENVFNWYVLFTTDANLTLDTADFTNNTLGNYLFANQDRGYLTYTNVNVTKNFVQTAIFHLAFLKHVRLSSVMISGNVPVADYLKQLFIEAYWTNNIVLLDVNVSRNQFSNIIDIQWTRIIIKSCIFFDNVISQSVFAIKHPSFQISDTIISHNRNKINANVTKGSMISLRETSGEFHNVNITSNHINFNLLYAFDSHTVVKNMSIEQNIVKYFGVLTHAGTIQLYNLTIKRNKWSSNFYLEKSNALIDGLQSIWNIISGDSPRFLFYDALSPSSISNGSYLLRQKKQKLIIANVFVEDKQRNVIIKDPPSIAIGAYYLDFSVYNLTLILKENQRNGIDIFFDGSDDRFKMQDIAFTCPIGSNVYTHSAIFGSKTTYKLFCVICPQNYYSLNGGHALLGGIDKGAKEGKAPTDEVVKGPKVLHQENVTCNKCPTGGECQAGLTRSRANYYGFKTTRNEVNYLPCLPQYCCDDEETPCHSYNTCNTNRYGTLCGSCLPGYRESYFSNKCMSKEVCNHQFIFWAFFFVTAICVMLFLCFIDNIKWFLMIAPRLLCDTFRNKIKSNMFQLTNMAVTKDIDSNAIGSTREASNVHNIDGTKSKMEQDEQQVGSRIEVEEKLNTPYTMQGVFNALLSFYQITSLLAVHTEVNPSESKFGKHIKHITDLFNLQVYFKFKYDDLCPIRDLDAVSKSIIKFGLFNVLMLVLVLLIWLLCFIYSKTTKGSNKKSLVGQLLLKLEIAFLRIITFGYKNVTTVALLLVSCVKVNDKFVLYIDGTIQCFQSQQYYVLAFISLWVIPMPFSLFYAYRFNIDGSISFREMLVCLSLPPLTVIFAVIAKRRKPGSIQHDTQQLKQVREMYEEPYRLVKGSNDRFIFWEHWRLLQRLLLSIIISYIKDPLWKIYFSSPLILLFFLVYLKVRPFKESMFILNWLEIASLIGICYQMLYNLFKGYIYLHNAPNKLNSKVLAAFFVNTEFLVTPLTLFVVYFLFELIVSIVNKKIRKKR